MNVVAHRGNRLHAPENTTTALISAYTAGADALQFDVRLADNGRLVVSRDASPQADGDFPTLLDELPAGIPKLIELRLHSDQQEHRGELVDKLMGPILERDMADDVIVYSRDPEALRQAQERAPYMAICTYDWEREPGEQVDLMEEWHADGLVIELDSIFGRGQLNEVGERLARLNSERDPRIGAVVYVNRDEPVFSDKEFTMLRKYTLVYGAATDSMLRVAPYVRLDAVPMVDVSFEEESADGRFVRDSGDGLGLLPGINGDFALEAGYDGGGLEMSVVNVDPGGEGDPFFQARGAPPFVGVEHSAEEGRRMIWNLGADAGSTRSGDPMDEAGASAGQLRLERRGPWFSGYFKEGEDGEWTCAGAVRNDSLNRRVFLRCVGAGGLKSVTVTRYAGDN